ncbi:right-handed parallel beta-helix repeat-containing protein [Opitutus terrae]|uniref:Right handed beta helix domain-containing protein n=1 Tax=Opitutus terrae (strain DSM 11246 / JCM 15787 / PB90-1) TaxID=452637 RepID=B1ZY45_OPITP|nr:right-handed parallel beta-helix repeat-containing protein [Opitutus terrae]ACB76194.1 conserved hypothetical protein [Opitutus terrae PB90-1]
MLSIPRFFVAISATTFGWFACASAAPVQFHVASDGSDQWSGTRAAPNSARTDGPFASLERARAAVQNADRTAGLEVVLHAGTYARSASLDLGPEDSGTAEHPVVWRVADRETAILSGAVTLRGFCPVADAAVGQRLQESVRDKVVWTDLRAQGITDFGTLTQRGSPGLELFFRGRRMQLARYPNTEWLLIADVPQTGPTRLHEGLEREKRFDGVPAGRHYGRITFDDPRPSHWAPDDNLYAHGYWTWDWSDSFQRVQSVQSGGRELTFAAPHHNYGYTRHQRFYFLNVLEEIDQPGEWYLDRGAGRLYFYPPATPGPDDVTVSILDTPFLRLAGARHVTIAGLRFTAGRAGGVAVREGEDCRIVGCTFSNLGDLAVLIEGGSAHEVRSCDFHDLALGAITVNGGNRPTLTPARHRVFNNHIHHFSHWLRTGQYGVMIDGVGQRVAHNLIHDAPFEAMYLRGNDHVVEFNDVHSVTQETGDAGAIHTGRDWTWRGNVIRHNYWHHLQGPGLHGVTAVYLDDFSSGFSVTGNIFYRAGRAVQIGGGRDNLVANNLFIECEPSVHLDARGLGWASNYFDGRYPWMFERFREMNADRPPYTERYPALATLLADEPAVPKGNRIVRNVSFGGRWLDVYDYFAFDFARCVELRDNTIADPKLWRRRAVNDGRPDPYFLNIDAVDGYSLLLSSDPAASRELAGNTLQTTAGRFDPLSLEFTAVDPAALARNGYEPIPVEKIGLERDEWRSIVPPRFNGR